MKKIIEDFKEEEYENVMLDVQKLMSQEIIEKDNEFTKFIKNTFDILKKYEDKIVIQQQVTIRNKRDFNAHRLLRAIANNTLLSKLPKTEECLVTDTSHHYPSNEARPP